MPITEITIENFKGISFPVEIPLRPITLLFGGNSAGKSTILQALHLFKEVLRTGSSEVDKLIPGTPNLDIGGFKQYVHNGNLDQTVKISVTMSVDDDGLPAYHIPHTSEEEGNTIDTTSVDLNVSTIGIEIEIRFDRTRNRSFVSGYRTLIDGHEFSLIFKEESAAIPKLLQFNYLIPCISQTVEELFPDDDLGGPFKRFMQQFACEEVLDAVNQETSHYRHNSPSPSATATIIEDYEDEIEPYEEWIPRVWIPMELFLTEKPIIPEARKPFFRDAENNLMHDVEYGAVIDWLFTRIITGSADLIRDELEGTRYIGSLRTIPERGYQGQSSISPDRWANGLAAWDLLSRATTDNKWLNPDSVNSLELGCLMDKLPESSSAPLNHNEIFAKLNAHTAEFTQLIADGKEHTKEMATAIKGIQQCSRELENMSFDSHQSTIPLTTLNGNTKVAPCDVGVGVSQVIPVVIGVMEPSHSILMIEQPELHIHPQVQCNLAEILAHQAVKNPSKIQLLETHSEHLILRLLRRIRELNEGELPDGAPKLTPAHLSVLYVNQASYGVEVTDQGVTETGSFKNRWPNGFFSERADELF
ncbi:AAA family ATPase [Verrucomicrobiaceae bacterium R5-34]|nr:AAA family ATPase [Verrucomicrobiaceae bacterium R5-34]